MPPCIPRRVDVHHRIVTAVGEQVETVYSFGGEVREIILRDESARFGIVITGLQIIKSCNYVIIISSICVADKRDSETLILFHNRYKLLLSIQTLFKIFSKPPVHNTP